MNQTVRTSYFIFAAIAVVAALGIGTSVFGARHVLPPKQGVQGHATMRFISGVPRPPEARSGDSESPFSGTIYVFKGHFNGSRPDLNSAYVVASATNGTFKIALEPGDYSLVMQSDNRSPTNITVTPNVWLQVTLSGEIMGC